MTTQDSSDGGTVVSITNNLSLSVDIYDVFNPSTDDNQKLPFVYTKLGAVNAGATQSVTTIRDVSMLQAMYTGKIKELSDSYYYQFPIKIMAATQSSDDDDDDSDDSLFAYTIAEADLLSMVQSFLFHKFVLANPDTKLATDLNTALASTDPSSVNTFFSNTLNFKNCTLASWNAVMNWQTMFTSSWQGTYYLYQTAPDPLPANYTPVLIAVLTIKSDDNTNDASLTSCGTDDGGNPVYANPSSITKVIMAGDGTMTDSNPGADMATSLTPVWVNTIQSTMQNNVPVSNYVINSAVTGMVAGISVVSSQTARQIPGQSAIDQVKSTFDSVFSSLWGQLGQIASLIMIYQFVKEKVNSGDEAKEQAKRNSKSQDDLKQQQDKIDVDTTSDISTHINNNKPTMDKAASDVSSSYTKESQATQENEVKISVDDTIKSVNKEINIEIQEGLTPTTSFEETYKNSKEEGLLAKADAKAGDFAKANQEEADAAQNMSNTLTIEKGKMTQEEAEVLKEAAEKEAAAVEENETIDEVEAKRISESKNEGDDSDFDPKSEGGSDSSGESGGVDA